MSKIIKQPEVGDVFRNRRKELGKTQKDVAATAGITEATYVRIEQGGTSPRWKTITAISNVLLITWKVYPIEK